MKLKDFTRLQWLWPSFFLACGPAHKTADRSDSTGMTAYHSGATQSHGTPKNGRLINGVRLQSSPFLNVRQTNNYGALHTIESIENAVLWVQKAYVNTPKLYVGDLSKAGGGPLKPHISHQNGLDVDIGIYLRQGHTSKGFVDAFPETMDLARTWTFVWALVSRGNVQYIFLDYSLQKALYEYALNTDGVDPKVLNAIFSYPRGKKATPAIVRHWPGHQNHLHVRFHADAAGPSQKNVPKPSIKPKTFPERSVGDYRRYD